MSEHAPLICAYRLDGNGGAESLDWAQVSAGDFEQGQTWVHLDATHAGTEAWLQRHGNLGTYVIDGLLASETRPRCDPYGVGVLVVLRGVNLNPGADPEDMVSIRIWIDEHRVISTRLRRLMAVDDIREQLEAGKGPVSTPHLVARLAARLTERMAPVIEALADRLAAFEEQLVEQDGSDPVDLRALRFDLVKMRRVVIALRRYIAPQRDAIARMSQLEEGWLDARVRGRLRETVDRVTRMTEELDEIRERLSVIQDELANRIAQRMERIMYVLTVVATIMLPLGFLTGLLGVNVAGIPGAETRWAFWAVTFGLALLVALEIWLFRRMKWL